MVNTGWLADTHLKSNLYFKNFEKGWGKNLKIRVTDVLGCWGYRFHFSLFYRFFACHTVLTITTLLMTYFLKSDYTRLGFITTYFLAEVSAQLGLKAQEVTYTELAGRREMRAWKLYGDKLLRNSLQRLVLTSCTGSNQRGGFTGGEQVPEGLGLLAKDSWAVQEPLPFPERGTSQHWGWKPATLEKPVTTTAIQGWNRG